MNKLTSILLVLFVAVSVVAQDTESLKKRHEEILQDQGDINFMTGVHYFGASDNVPVSIFATDTEKCIYGKLEGSEFYRTISASEKATSLTLFFSDRIIKDGVVKRADYEICFQTGERLHGYHVIVDEDRSDLVASRANWMKLIGCVLKHAPQLYNQVKTCIKSKKFMQCLKIVGPGIKVYQCMKGQGVDAAIATVDSSSNSEVSTQQVIYRTIAFSWSWGYSTGFRANPIYKEMPNQIVGFDSVKINSASNAWGVRVGATPSGNNIAKIWLEKASYMAYPRFWSSRVSGSIRCVMQK